MKRNHLVLFVILVLAICAPSAAAQAPTNFGATRAPDIKVDQKNNLYLVMSVATSPRVVPHSQIFFTMSRNGGASWDNLPLTRNLSRSPGEAFGPSLAINRRGKTRLYVAYQDNSNGTTQARLIVSKKGTKFLAPRNITPHDGGAFFPRIALDSSETLHVVWGDTLGGTRRVVYQRSSDRGVTFTEAVNLSQSPAEAFEPEIAVGPDDSINVVWQDNRSGVNAILFARSADGGESFSEPVSVSTGEGAATDPHIAVDQAGRIHVVWVDASGGDLQTFYARSVDGGATFSEPLNLSNEPGARMAKPYVAAFQNKVAVAYNDERQASGQVFLVLSEDAGQSFSSRVRVSQADTEKGVGHSAAMAFDNRGRLHIVYIDSSVVGGDKGLLFYRNTTNGRNFTAPFLILAGL